MTVRPLAGISVLDLTTFLSGPYAVMALGQLGASVVKVEPPTGDPTRAGKTEPDSDFWFALHRGRRSVVLDLKNDDARAQLLQLVQRSDVVVDNARAGVMERLGLPPAVLREANSRVITCSITGYGESGPLARGPAIDGVIQAFTGAFDFPEAFGDTPGPLAVQIADLAGGAAASQAILAALFEREQTGRGVHVSISLIDALMPWLSIADRSATMKTPNTIVALGSDGKRFVVQTPLHFRARLASLLQLEFTPTADYAAEARAALASKPRDEWLQTLATEGIPAAPVHSYAEALSHPATATETVGTHMVPASPFVFDGQRNPWADAPPGLGRDNLDVLGA